MGKKKQQVYEGYQGMPPTGAQPRPMCYGMGAAPAAAPAPGQAGYATGAPDMQVAGYAPQTPADGSWGYAQPYPGYAQGRSVQMPPEKPKKRRWLRVLIILLLLAIVIGVACYFLLDCSGGSRRSGVAGQLEGKSEAEIQAEIDRVVDEGMFNISIASSVQMASPTSPAELRIENVPGNHYLMRVVIVEEQTGTQLYETDLIEPNFHIQQDTLDVALDPGVHTCLAIFYAYDPDTEEEVGQAAARISIQVGT